MKEINFDSSCLSEVLILGVVLYIISRIYVYIHLRIYFYYKNKTRRSDYDHLNRRIIKDDASKSENEV